MSNPVDLDAARAGDATVTAKQLDPLVVEPRDLAGVIPVATMKSRHASASPTSSDPFTASRAAGAWRAAAIASPGRKSVFEGMHAQ